MAARPKPMSLLSPKEVNLTTTEQSLPTKLNRTDSIEAPEVVRNTTKSDSPKLLDLPKGNEADMAKVLAYQKKLNAKGLNVKEDGIWGDETAAASRVYYNRYQKPKTISNASTKPSKSSNIKLVDPSMKPGDKEFKSIPVTPSNKMKITPPTDTDPTYFKDRNKVSSSKNPIKAIGKDSLEYGRSAEFQSKFASSRKRQTMQLKRENELASNRREAAINEKMIGDEDMHQPALTREQAERAVDIESEDSQKIGKVIKGVGVGGAALAGAALVGLGIRGKLKNTRAIQEAAKLGEELPKKMNFGGAVLSELRSGAVGKLANKVQDKANSIEKKIVEPIKKGGGAISELKNMGKNVAKAQQENAYKKSMKLGQLTDVIEPTKRNQAANDAIKKNFRENRSPHLARPVGDITPVDKSTARMNLKAEMQAGKSSPVKPQLLLPAETPSTKLSNKMAKVRAGKTKKMKLTN